MSNRERRTISPDIATIEQMVLAEICCCDVSPIDVAEAIEQLRNYHWLQPEHATVFQAMRSVDARARERWRDILPAQATRMGFPDVDWRRYFGADVKSTPGLAELVRRLTKAAKP